MNLSRLLSCSIKSELGRLSSPVSRELKGLVREISLAGEIYKQGTLEGHKKLLRLVRKHRELNELTSRTAAYSFALSLKLNRLQDAHDLSPLVEYCPPVISRSLKVKLLVKEGKLDDAIDKLEEVLNEEESTFFTENHCIADEALDELHQAISSREDSLKQMQRFRHVQRLLSSFNRRSKLSIDQLLSTPIAVPSKTIEEDVNIQLTDKVLEQIPHFLSENK